MPFEIDPDFKRSALKNYTFKNLDEKIYVKSDLNHKIPRLRYFHSEREYLLEGWPSWKHYLIREDGSKQLTQTNPLLDLMHSTIGIFTPLDRGILHYSPEYSEWYENNEHQVKEEIHKFLFHIPIEISDTFMKWNPFTSYYWKAIQASAKHDRYFQLSHTNPGLAFLLLQRKLWKKDHPLARMEPIEFILQN